MCTCSVLQVLKNIYLSVLAENIIKYINIKYFLFHDCFLTHLISQQHSSNDFMNSFISKIDTIRDQIVTTQLPAEVSHQIVHCRSPEEQFHSFSTIGEEELYKLVKSAKPTTCVLVPIPPKPLKRCFQKS